MTDEIVTDLDFGDDDGRDDMFDASGAAPDPEPVTIWMHEERVRVGVSDLPLWHRLTAQEQAISRLIGYEVLRQIEAGREPDDIADWLDDFREMATGHRIKRKERRRDRDLIEALIGHLIDEGTLQP